MVIVKVKSISKRYGKKQALSDVSFEIEEGSVVGYLGPNGSGKTTTILAMSGLIKLSKGSISVLGCDVETQYDSLFAKVAALFDHNGLYERLTARQNLKFYLSACGKRYHEDEVKEVMGQLELGDVMDKKVKKYSKGMKRKLALARILLAQPQFLLLDEPFDGIDIEQREVIISMLKAKQKETKMTILLTSHVMADIEELADQIIVINEGNLMVHESLVDFQKRSDQGLTKIYLEVLKDARK